MAVNAKREMLSLVDAAWLHMEMPTNLMMVGSVGVLAAPPDEEHLLRTLEQRLAIHPRFRQRVEDSPAGPPWWVPDASFDIKRHMHRIALPAPAGDAELRVLLGDLMSTPLDMSRPLWDMHVIEGHPAGCMLFTRLHHCIGDGTALIQLLMSLTSTTREGSLRAPRHKLPEHHRNLSGVLNRFDPRRVPGEVLAAAAHAYTLARLSFLWPDAQTPLRGTLGRAKRVAWTEPLAIDALRPLRKATAATVNDIVVTAITGALRAYLHDHGDGKIPHQVRALVPVDLRASPVDGGLGNDFGLVFLGLPVGVSDRRQRLESVHEQMQAALHSPQPSVALEVLGGLGLTPKMVQRQVVRFFGAKGTTVVTNVRGPSEQLYLAGEALRDMWFFVPQSAGLSLGVSIFSYNGTLRVGVIADAGLIPDPVLISDEIDREFHALTHRPGVVKARKEHMAVHAMTNGTRMTVK